MFRQMFVTVFLLSSVWQNAEGAMKKSWKSAANFDAEIPKFTPFENKDNFGQQNLDEVQMKTTKSPSNPSPTAETLPGKISSKIKAPTKHVAEMYNKFRQEQEINANKDFGVFNANLVAQAGQAAHEDRFESIAEEHLDIEQVVSQLTEEALLIGDSKDNSVESDDDLEITPIGNIENTNVTQYKVGPLMNVTIDSDESLVNVNLDQNTLKEIFTGSGS